MTFKVNDRVYYRDDGPDAPGTITEIGEFKSPYGVEPSYVIEWDDGIENGAYTGAQIVKV